MPLDPPAGSASPPPPSLAAAQSGAQRTVARCIKRRAFDAAGPRQLKQALSSGGISGVQRRPDYW